jgi:hypothetical protein
MSIERVNGDVILREVKQSFWIKKLKTYDLIKKLDRHWKKLFPGKSRHNIVTSRNYLM